MCNVDAQNGAQQTQVLQESPGPLGRRVRGGHNDGHELGLAGASIMFALLLLFFIERCCYALFSPPLVRTRTETSDDSTGPASASLRSFAVDGGERPCEPESPPARLRPQRRYGGGLQYLVVIAPVLVAAGFDPARLPSHRAMAQGLAACSTRRCCPMVGRYAPLGFLKSLKPRNTLYMLPSEPQPDRKRI